MAGQKKPIFELDDADSVGTDSTVESVEEVEYEVEKILFDQYDQSEQVMKYLVKWVGYPLHRATFEVAENFMSDDILQEWEHQKSLIDRGEIKAFDIQEYIDAYSLAYEQKAQRRVKREAKRELRRKHASAASHPTNTPDAHVNVDEDQDEDEDEIAVSLPSRTASTEASVSESDQRLMARTHRKPLRRKGVAVPVSKRRTIISSSPETSESEGQIKSSEDSDSDDSLLDEIRDRIRKQKETNIAPPTANKTNHAQPSPKTGVRKSTPSSRVTLPSQSPGRPDPPPMADGKAKPPVKPAASTASRINVSSVLTNWEADTKKKPESRAGKRLPTDADGRMFQNLGHQHNYQKYSRREPAPDISSLVMIDPKTGKPETTATMATTKASSMAPVPRIPDEYRRSPRPERKRSISPPPERAMPKTLPAEKTGPGASYIDNSGPHESTKATIGAPSVRPWGKPHKKEMACWFWRHHYCSKSEDQCEFAHRDTGMYAPEPISKTYNAPKPALDIRSATETGWRATNTFEPTLHNPRLRKTCFWWKYGGCNKPDDQCEHAHFETGLVQRPVTKDVECRYWRQGVCRKSSEACPFAHPESGQANADLSPGRRRSVLTAANREPLTERSTVETIGKTYMKHPEKKDPRPDSRLQDSSTPRRASGPSTTSGETLDPATRQPTAVEARSPTDRRDSASSNTQNGTIRVQSEGTGEPWELKAQFEVTHLPPFIQIVGESPQLHMDRTVLASDARDLVYANLDPKYGLRISGDVTFDLAFVPKVDSLASTCRLHSCGLLATLKNDAFKMIIFPCNAEEWKFLDGPKPKHTAAAQFCFQIFRIPPGFRSMTETSSEAFEPSIPKAIVSLGQRLEALDIKRLFHVDDGKMPDRAVVFLMIPSAYYDELEVYTKFFTALKCKVYTSQTPGAWSYVREKHSRSCLLIVHPEVPLWQVPGLYNFIISTGAGLRIFSLGVHRAQAVLEDRPPRFECIRIFPHGTVYYITDEVFLNQPQLATLIIRQYVEQHRTKPEGGENDRIATRPGVKNWLLDLALTKTVDGGRDDASWLKLYDAISHLNPLDDEDPYDLPNPLPDANLVSLSPDLMPHFTELLQHKDQDEFAPTDWMVNWFAGWSVSNVTEYRKFIVCHSPKQDVSRSTMVMNEYGQMVENPTPVNADPRGWAARYQHIGVMTPEECLKRKK